MIGYVPRDGAADLLFPLFHQFRGMATPNQQQFGADNKGIFRVTKANAI